MTVDTIPNGSVPTVLTPGSALSEARTRVANWFAPASGVKNLKKSSRKSVRQTGWRCSYLQQRPDRGRHHREGRHHEHAL